LRIEYLSRKKLKSLLKELENRSEIAREFIEMVSSCETAKIVIYDKFTIYVFDSTPMLFTNSRLGNALAPTLFVLNTLYNTKRLLVLPTVRVDSGAVDPILRGADVMAPGIEHVYRDFDEGHLVAVMEPKERYLIAVGIALMSSTRILESRKGKAVRVASRLNDDVWQACLELARKSGA